MYHVKALSREMHKMHIRNELLLTKFGVIFGIWNSD